MGGPGLPNELNAPRASEEFDSWKGRLNGLATGGDLDEAGKLKGACGGCEPKDEWGGCKGKAVAAAVGCELNDEEDVGKPNCACAGCEPNDG